MMNKVRRAGLGVILAIGVGLVAAPAIFQMFDRAPQGGKMIDAFRPYMTEAKVAQFQGYMREIGAAEAEARRAVVQAGIAAPPTSGFAQFSAEWPGIDADMGDMLRTMERSVDNFAAVDAMPPFVLFPWFFVGPGLIIAVLVGLVATRGPRPALRVLLVVMGIGLIAAPAIFQMFSRAPKGGEMINDFRPLMTSNKVTTIQRYFLVIGAGEGDLRTRVAPELRTREEIDEARFAERYPATSRFFADWPTIAAEMAPMIGAMSDNVPNFAAVDALPPFRLFPWFFVVPGVIVAVLAIISIGRVDEGAE